MKHRPSVSTPATAIKRWWPVIGIASVAVLAAGVWFGLTHGESKPGSNTKTPPNTAQDTPQNSQNPLDSRTLYRDDSRQVTTLVAQHSELQAIAKQPGSTWLVGPNASDQQANRDITAVGRTSQEAAKQRTVPVYVLYAIPQRDACAPFSNGGFADNTGYLAWIQSLLGQLRGDAVFVVEPDAVAHTRQSGCMSETEVAQRLDLIKQTVTALKASPHVIGVYLDAGNSEWYADPSPLVEPLRSAGIEQADGIAVNVSNFIATSVITPWAQQFAQSLSTTKRLGVLIDTSRNGKGAPDASVQGTARWCNPAGRGLGAKPTTKVADDRIDAYVWIKNAGESDGDCFGNPPAGTFNLQKALELARNAE
jgi:endoglucanase